VYHIITLQHYSAQTCIVHISHLYLQVQIQVERKSHCVLVPVVKWPAVNFSISSSETLGF